MRYRIFRDHMGRWHRVRIGQDEALERRIYWAGFYGICIGFGAILCAVSGILG